MPQFLIHAKDYTDVDALSRRLDARSAHLNRMKEEKEKNVFIAGGALLNPDEKMIGSVLIVNMEDELSVSLWIKQDPYVVNNVWDEITITPFRLADV